GRDDGILQKIMDEEKVGTRFIAKNSTPVHTYDRWLLAAKGFGQIVVDEGAENALAQKKSLLLPGITQIKGHFGKNEVVEIISRTGLTLAYGKTNFSHKEIQRALEDRKKDPSYILNKAVIHRDYMVNA